jgi:hypothetical protein
MSQHKWTKNKTQNYVWTWFQMESSNGIYEVVPILHSCLNNKELYFFEITHKGKMIAVTTSFNRISLKIGQEEGRVLAESHLES